MIDSQQDEEFAAATRSLPLKMAAAVAAVAITALVFAGYTLLRKRHAQTSGSLVSAETTVEPRKPPKALVTVNEALLQGGTTILGGTVRNTSTEKLEGLSVELELKRRKDGAPETQLLTLEPAQLEPDQEGRYSLQLKVQDYSSARVIALKAGPSLAPLAYTTAPGLKRPSERLETKTITTGKPGVKPGEFLNSPDNPARVP